MVKSVKGLKSCRNIWWETSTRLLRGHIIIPFQLGDEGTQTVAAEKCKYIEKDGRFTTECQKKL